LKEESNKPKDFAARSRHTSSSHKKRPQQFPFDYSEIPGGFDDAAFPQFDKPFFDQSFSAFTGRPRSSKLREKLFAKHPVFDHKSFSEDLRRKLEDDRDMFFDDADQAFPFGSGASSGSPRMNMNMVSFLFCVVVVYLSSAG